MFGINENSHSEAQVQLDAAKALLTSIADEPLPHQVCASRMFCAVNVHGKRIHTEGLRGATIQGVLATAPGYAMEVFPFPEYHCCVLRDTVDGAFYIPTTRSGEQVLMIGCCPGSEGLRRSKLTYHAFDAGVLSSRMEPVGPTHMVVTGLRKAAEELEDDVAVCLPRFNCAKLHEIDEFREPGDLITVQFDDLVGHALHHPYEQDPRTQPSVVIGTVPHVWYWFIGSIQSHRLLTGGEVGRFVIQFRPASKSITDACDTQSEEMKWVDRRER